jgi:8-hydroxy-5-deazaflavin:NADPH oxidoreductase
MEIGIIGAGAVGLAFAKRVLEVGHRVKLSNSRGPESLRDAVASLGNAATAATREEAAACEMVLLAVPWDNIPEVLGNLPRWKNQILIDATNPFHGNHGKFTPASVGNLSTSQLVAGLAPGARVVKALNNLIVEKFEADPVVDGARRVAFISGDDGEAKKKVKALIESFGFAVIDLGNLHDGGLFQQAGGPLAGRDLYQRGEY